MLADPPPARHAARRFLRAVRAGASARLHTWVLAPAALAMLAAAGGSGAGQATCSTSAQFGSCPYPPYTVNQDMWRPGPGSAQVLTAQSAGQWQVQSYQPGGAPVRSYPDVSENLGHPISDYTTVVATFADQTPAKVVTNASFDLWVNGAPGVSNNPGMIEVMIWTDDQGLRPGGSKRKAITFGGKEYTLWDCPSCVGGHPYYAFVINHNEASGKAYILTALQWLTQHKLIPASDPLTQVDYGWEIQSTGGAAPFFKMSSYRLQTALKSE